MISIAVIVPELLPVPPVQGGAVEHWVHEVCNRLTKENYSITVFSRPAGITAENDIHYVGIPWTRTERWFNRVKERVTWNNPLRYITKIQNVYSYGRRVAMEVKRFDIIYIHNEPNLLLLINKQPRQKIILHMHNDHLSFRPFRSIYRRALAKVDKIICVSDFIRRCAVQHFPEFAERFCVIFNSTDPSVFKPYGNKALLELESVLQINEKKQYLLYVGRLTPIKGVHVLIEAFQKINQKLPNTRLIIAGSSFFGGAAKTSYEQHLVKLAEPASHSIIFTGYLPHEKLKYLYSVADVVVFPSIWGEPCSLVVLEAMASGTCCVSSKVGGVPELVDDQKNGVLVPPNKTIQLADAICGVLTAPHTKQKMEVAARAKIIAGYTWERLVEEIESLFGKLK